ncbi:sugar ABC transporter substrate-binding protein [Paramicrobacterium chengjingii]|uniref:sugar ABC transporter substrate-binding protein n=1 Tax=Paramicrobacterium chengjingii TaxID=2769067 RepID=UPI001422C6AC|nr:substrate-binding domain-containing protein [Microbacterium chengjingii]
MKLMKPVMATLAAAGMIALAGCSSGQSAGDPDDLTIGISMSTLQNPFFNTVKNGATAKAKDDGNRTIVSDAQNDTQKQLNDVQDMITKGVDVIILNPVEPESATPIVELANDRDIPIITVDRSSSGGEVASHIASDNVEGGRMICDWLGKALEGEGKLAILEGIAGTSPELDRDEGCNAALEEYPDIEVVASQPADWDREKGYTVTQNILQANPDLTAIFGRNDLAALGAVEAAQQAGKLNDLTVISFDGIQDALESIKAGDLSATVVQDPILMGETAIETAVALASGESVERVQDLPVKVADETNIEEFLE